MDPAIGAASLVSIGSDPILQHRAGTDPDCLDPRDSVAGHRRAESGSDAFFDLVAVLADAPDVGLASTHRSICLAAPLARHSREIPPRACRPSAHTFDGCLSSDSRRRRRIAENRARSYWEDSGGSG